LKGGIPYASKEKSGRQKGSCQEKNGDQEKGNQQEETLALGLHRRAVQ
jgi:hypothetical protein